VPTDTLLSWRSLTAAVNEMKSPNQFLTKLLFGRHETKPTETIELGIFENDRVIAPFVRKNGQAIQVAGNSEKFISIEPPNIRLKRPFTPSELLFRRRPGTVIHAEASDITSAMRAHIGRDLQVMSDQETNAKEWLAAMAIRGTITYSVDDFEHFSVTFAKPAGNTVTLAGDDLWDNADASLPDPAGDFHTAKKLINDAVGLGVTDAIMGEEAAAAFRLLMERRQGLMDFQKIQTGSITFTEQFSADGVIYMGTFCGVRCWEYSRSASLNGVATPMIRTNYVEFVCADAASDHVLYFGAIADMKALQGQLFQAERFSKSWEEEDPSSMQALLTSRPLPTMRRPGSVVSMQVSS
jgi:hypothetical protein